MKSVSLANMETKLQIFWWFLLCQAFLYIRCNCQSQNGKLGNIEFTCPQGQYFTGGFCIMPISVKMDWWSAMVTCKRHGYELFWADDIDDYNSVDHLTPESWTNYWSGLNVTSGIPKWTFGESKDLLLSEVFWENGQPDKNKETCVYAKKNGYFSFGNCLSKLPFICKSHAVLKGYFRCRNGNGIKRDFLCDGHNDCGDLSDENNCGINTAQCSKVVDAVNSNSGSISSSNGVYNSAKSCYWTIVAGVGQTIKITVKSFQTEKSTDILHFRTGGMGGDIYLGELTGTSVNPLPTYYSSDNIFTMRFITDNSVQTAGFTIDWTTNVPEVFTEVQMLTATSSMKELKSPFYDIGYLPHEKVLEWVITAETKNVVTLEFVDLKIGTGGRMYLWDGKEKTLEPTLDGVRELKPNIFTSKSNSVRLMLRSEGGGIAAFNKGLYFKYWEGCIVNHQLNEGIIQSPGFQSGSYPDNVDCRWTLKRPQGETRPISLRFNSFNIQSASDYVKIFNDTSSSQAPSSPLHTDNGFTGSDDLTEMVFHSTSGIITVEFQTNFVLTDKGFEAEFSVDCSTLVVSSQTNMNSNEMYETSFRSEVTLTCDTGYSFKQEEYNEMSAVTIRCEKGGKWNVSRTPDCMITYCPIPPNIVNGFISASSGVIYGANVTYECNDGFSMNGSNVIECMDNGKWSTAPTCQAVRCSNVIVPENGGIKELNGDAGDFASVVQFTCNEGYELIGNLTIYCKTGSIWSHETPVCEKIWCPLPRIRDGRLDSTNDLRFEETATLTCESGYGINGTTDTSMVVTCGSDGFFNISPCLDIDECENSQHNCSETEICNDRRGSFICTCKDGFEKLPENPHCTDINECKLDPKLCENCTNAEPGYTCHCPLGYILYTEDGFNNVSLAEGETGLLQGDVYHINHTCVRKQCPLPADIPNGKVLTKKKLILYEDKVEYECNHGFNTSDSTTLTCENDGQYSSNPPACTVTECHKPLASEIDRAVEVYPKTVPRVVYGTEVNIECQYGSQMINRTLYCSYNVMKGQYEMMGDAAQCPEINCGEPEVVPGSNYKERTGNSLNSTFIFDCDNGFALTGKSLNGTNTVTCEENGRWNLGNLTCLGERCSDPGTPGGAIQVVKSYEVGQVLSFQCNKSGYYPSPPESLECIVDNGKVEWNTTDLPECQDMTPPMFSNCPTDHKYIDKSDSYTYTVPTATDNSGVKGVKSISYLSPNRGPGNNTNDDISIVYQAEDYSGNIANCTIQIKIKDYAKQMLKCPSSYPYNTKLIDTADGITYNVSDSVTVTNDREDIVLQYNPSELINLDHTDIGNPQIVEVTATDKWGGQDKCRFHLTTSAAACFKESFPNVQYASQSCTNGNVSCTLTCDTGYILFDGNSSRTYNCEGENMWTPALPPQYACLGYDEPAYLIEFMVVYTTATTTKMFASDCVTGLQQLLLNDLKEAMTSEIHSICNNNFVTVGDIEITGIKVDTNSFDFPTVFTIKLLDTAVEDKVRKACGSILNLQVPLLNFLMFTNNVTCKNGPSPVDRKNSENNNIRSEGNSCTAGIQKMTDKGEKCIKCPPGTFSSSGDACTECPDGKFQDMFGLASCKTCPDQTPVPSSDKTTCLARCPPGFFSEDGLKLCQPCPENTYWFNSTYCKSCPDGGKTLGFDGVDSVSGCKSPCETGQYSVTGYVPCKPCPVHFYQDETGQDMCKECKADQITQTTGSKNQSDCIDLDTLDYCNNTCNGHGQCSYDGHGIVCNCALGFVGENCETKLDPCSSSPCWNGGTCTKTGYDTYNCSCPLDTSCKMVREADKSGQDADWDRNDTKSQSNLEACEQFCLDSPDCKSVHFDEGYCFVFNKKTTATNKAGATYSIKQCRDTKLFGNHRCEDDLVNSCKNDTCSEHGMCQDLLGDKAKCLCPVTGVFTGDKCEQDTNLCNPDPCDHGTCVSYDSVRYQCVCEPGYTGKDCDVNINECSANPKGCLYNGTCVDKVNDYECSCKQGFHGDRCKDVPDFCSSKPCPEGICYGDYNEFEFTCKCEEPYRLAADGTCEMIPPCEGVECVNGTCGSDGKCDCTPGFEGSLCQHNIDDCKSRPCQHRGQCTDLLNDYECDCPPGYNGKNCENNINDCVAAVCTDSNVERCQDLVNDYRCICKPGYTGRNCTDDINECRSYPCSHSGKCTDLQNDFSCECPQGWTGKQCELPEDFCSSSPCLNNGQCYNMTDGFFCRCRAGTKGDTCEDFPDVCNVINPCTNSAQCKNVAGTAECSCTNDYDGSSCQLINYQCGDADTCKNDGKCSTKDKGFQCDCPDSFSGTTCDTYTDPCSNNPCHSSAKCISETHRHICYCQNGGYLTDSGCKDMDENFDLYMDSEITDLPGFLRTPLVMPNNSDMTIMFWFRVIGDGSTLLTLEPVGISYPWPLFRTSIVKILTNKIMVNNFTADKEVEYGQETADGKWHFFVLSWERNGNTKVFIDSISIIDKVTVSAEQLPHTLQVIFGAGETNGRISKLRIYRTVFSDVDIYKSIQTLDHLKSKENEIVQTWANLAFTRSTFRKYPSQVQTDVCDKGFSACPADDDRTKPTVTTCPKDRFEVGKKSELTVVTGVKSSVTFSEATSINSSVHEDEVYTFGRTNEVVVGYDDAMNYAICRFKIYIKYYEQCPMPDTDASVVKCENSQSICSLNCNSGKSLSIDHRNTYTCGRLGVFNYQHPWKQFVLPTCGDEAIQNIALTVTMKYRFIINCMNAQKDGLKTKLNGALANIKNFWSDISCNSENCEVTTNCVDVGKEPEVNVVLKISGLRPTTTKDGKTYTMREAMLIIILQEYLLLTDDIKDVGQANLLNDTVMVTVSPSCSTGYVVLGDTCVQCGKGTYRNDSTMACEFCPIGTYQVLSGQTTCQECSEGKTTLTYGSYLSTDCVDDCQPGKFYDKNTQSCTDCLKDHYQNISGQEFCHRCPIGFKTSGKGSNSSSICYADCEAGKELQPDGKCKSCSRGYYRTQNDDKCVSCGDVYTTEGEGTKSSDDCNIKICTAGNFRNGSNVCVPCPVGQYQSEDLKDDCDKCSNSYTTDGDGKTHKDNCTFYCPAGYEVNPAMQEACRPCPRGSYRSTESDQILMPCINCSDGNTTESDRSESSDQCTIRRCKAGQIIDKRGECKDCPMDTYQPVDMPTSLTECIPCSTANASPQKGTMGSGTAKQDDCKVICKEGEQNDGDSCSPCPQGTWSNGDDTMRFQMCTNCSDLWTTEGQGSTHSDNCTLRDCDPGYYIDGNDCIACGFAQYQPNRHALSCLSCTENQNTSTTGSTQQSACQIFCGRGESGTEKCEPCKFNYIKPSAGIAECEACTGNETSNDARTACSELFCDVGLYNMSGKCVPCDIGLYKDLRGNDKTCVECEEGYTTAGVGSGSKADCNVLNCVPGKFKNETSNMCEPCPVKTYKSAVGNSECLPCADDKTTNGSGSTSPDDCSLVYCSPGQKRNDDNKCEDCPVGYYQPEYGKSNCSSCKTGYTTSDVKTENKSQCHEICLMGFSFDSATKVCIGCPLGSYKPEKGNDATCTKCPDGNTTAYVNSTSITDCSIPDCLAGSKRDGGGCALCEKGKYQPENSSTTCKECGTNKTTENTGSKKSIECIDVCGDGKEYNLATKQCEFCSTGFHTVRPTTEKCVQCPVGFTTLFEGSNNCVKGTTVPQPQPTTSSFKITYRFIANIDCANVNRDITNVYINNMKAKIIERLNFLAITYPGICGKSGCNMTMTIKVKSRSCPAIDGKRRRRVATNNDLEFDVTIPSVLSTVTNNKTNNIRTTASVLQEDVTTNIDDYNPEPKSLTPESAIVQQTVECGDGMVDNKLTCVECPVGTKKNSTDTDCVDCPLNYYQDSKGQNSCKQCTGVKKYTLATKSTSESSCVSDCIKNPNYCSSHGTCQDDNRFSVYCNCNSGYEGSLCESRAATTSSTSAIIGGAVGGSVVLLLVIFVTVLVCRKCNPSNKDIDFDERKLQQIENVDTVDYYNPMYVYGRPPPMKAIRFEQEWDVGHNPYQPYIAQNTAKVYDSDSYYSASPRGRHEWYATSE